MTPLQIAGLMIASSVVHHQRMIAIDEGSEIPAVAFEPIRIDPNIVATIFNPGQPNNGRQITAQEFFRPPTAQFSQAQDPNVWTPEEMEAIRRNSDAWFATRDVQDAHDRFRRCYLGNGKTPSLCRYMEHVEPHLHAPRRLRRIGHLPMMTMKELPE